MTEAQFPWRAIWWCWSVYCIAHIVWVCGLVTAVPQYDSQLPQRLVVRGEEDEGSGPGRLDVGGKVGYE